MHSRTEEFPERARHDVPGSRTVFLVSIHKEDIITQFHEPIQLFSGRVPVE